jgi:TatD DNase family protein
MKFIDTHCNIPNILQKIFLNSNDILKKKIYELKNNSFGPFFEGCISVSSDVESQKETLKLIEEEEDIWGAFGIHPLYSEQFTLECEAFLLKTIPFNKKIVAWGEIGLDYHNFPEKNYSKPELQKKIFIQQMKHAINLKKPIIIHTREAEQDTFNLMKIHIPKDWKIHVHCFTDSLKFAKKLLEEYPNLFIGFTGIITFKNSILLQNTVKEIPLSRILLETDGPFMTPVPYRGKICHPGYIPKIAEKIAELKQIPLEIVYEVTRKNTNLMYGI